jgi:hypothetical protein
MGAVDLGEADGEGRARDLSWKAAVTLRADQERAEDDGMGRDALIPIGDDSRTGWPVEVVQEISFNRVNAGPRMEARHLQPEWRWP